MKPILFALLVLCFGCHHSSQVETLSFIQIQDRNGLSETISNSDRLLSFETIDFFSSQPYKKVLRVYKNEGKNHSRITTYHPNGMIHQYLEAAEMRANGAYREWFANGQQRVEAHVVGGTADLAEGTQEDWLFDSLSKVWDEQGNLVATILYDKGVLEGKSTYYFPDGSIEKELFFAKGNLEKETLEYWPNGTLRSKTHYKRGVKEGESVGFFEDGTLAWIEDHSDDRLRTGAYYNPKGDLISEVGNGGGTFARVEKEGTTFTEYRSGIPDGLVRKLNAQGELQKSFFIKRGIKQGEEIDYFLPSEVEAGVQIPAPRLSIFWNDNRIHGPVKTWYNNRQLQSQREFCRNQKTGPALAWYRDGSLMLYEEYEEDRLLKGQYYKIQRKEPVSSVVNGNGLVTLFDEVGNFVRKINYLNGKPIDKEE